MAECTRLKVKTVAIPSIGAGQLNYPPDVVAQIIVSEAFLYIEKNQGNTTLEKINFVIFEKSLYDMFQAIFQSTMATSRPKLTDSLAVTNQLTKQEFKFSQGLQLQLLQVDPTNDESQVMVIYSYTKNQLNTRQAIAAIHDMEIGRKLILTIKNFSHNHPEVIKLICQCLEKAETKRYRSIALGGIVRQNAIPEQSIIEAITTFIADNNPLHLKCIRVIFRDLSSDTLKRYTDAVEKAQIWHPPSDTQIQFTSFWPVNETSVFLPQNSDSRSEDQSEITIHIYGESAAAVSNGETSLRSSINSAYNTDVMKGADISMLLDYKLALDEIQENAKSNFVEVKVNHISKSITLYGQTNQVTNVKQVVAKTVHSLNEFHHEKIQWVRLTGNGNSNEYDKNLNYAIEKAFKQHDEAYHCKERNFKIDFRLMAEIDLSTYCTVKVKRMDHTKQGTYKYRYICNKNDHYF